MKQITAKDLLSQNHLLIEDGKTCEAHTHLVVKQMIRFAKLHVKAALKKASEKADWNCISEDSYFGDLRDYDFCERDNDGDKTQIHNIIVDKDSILNAYDLNNIK